MIDLGGPRSVLPSLDLPQDPQTSKMLLQAFETFNQATLKLQSYYRGLEDKIHELNHELSFKNKELENNLLEKERVKNYLSNIFNSSAIGIIVTDLDGVVTSANPIGCQLMDRSAEDIEGLSLNQLFSQSLVPKKLTSQQWGTYESVKEQDVDYYHKNGSKLRLRASISLMYSAGGDVLGWIINLQNITELKKLEAQLERKNRFEVMGEMAATIAHEIRNPLGSIELFAALLRKELDPQFPQRNLIEHISSAINSMNHIISNLLEYSKPRNVSWEILDLQLFIQGMLQFLEPTMANNQIQSHAELHAEQSWIRSEKELLKQVFHNLFLNAIQSMLEPGLLTVKARNLETRDPKIRARFKNHPHTNTDSMKLIEITIQDTGMGMTKEVRSKIFDPFFTTREQGTGLGLSIVHTIIESHDALIDVESEVGQGTQVILLFPVVDAALASETLIRHKENRSN